MKFPKTLYVRIDKDGDDTWFITEEELINAIEKNGPTVIASYTLASTDTYRKEITVVSKNGQRAK